MTARVIGIDVGLSGACAMLGTNGMGLPPHLLDVADLPVMAKGSGSGKVKNEINPAALNELLKEWVHGFSDDVLVVVESVSAMPGQGVAGVFSLGDSRGAIRGVLAARGYPVAFVSPGKWKRHFGLTADKELARARAIQLYPQAELARKKDADRAEAILVARYGWEVLR